jgi:ribosomal protein S18 acetylase RimI-like enzyme
MIWHLAVHPEHQRRGVAAALLAEAERLATERGIVRFEAWAQGDDPSVRGWYGSLGFREVDSYLHVCVERDEGLRDISVEGGELKLVRAFAHYTGDRADEIRQRFRRVRDSVLLERRFE